MMDRFELQRLRDLPIEGVAERLGLRVSRHVSLCPFHPDKHPSLHFDQRRNTCRCFVCMDRSLGPIDLVMRHLGVPFMEARRWLADTHNVILDEWKPTFVSNFQSSPYEGDKRGSFDPNRYLRFFLRPWLSPEARRFLFDERRLDPRVIAWCRLTSWRDRDGINWLQIPYFDVEGQLIGVQNRNLQPPSIPPREGGAASSIVTLDSPPQGGVGEGLGRVPRFRFPSGSRCSIYNLPVLKLLRPGDECWIAEGCSDCWSLLSDHHKAIAIPSATLLQPKDTQLLQEVTSRLQIRWKMAPDQDAPGRRLFDQLQKFLPMLQHIPLPEGCKDYSDFFLQQKR